MFFGEKKYKGQHSNKLFYIILETNNIVQGHLVIAQDCISLRLPYLFSNALSTRRGLKKFQRAATYLLKRILMDLNHHENASSALPI